MHRQVVPVLVDHMLPPPDNDNQVIKYIRMESETAPEQDLVEEPEYNIDVDEEEVEEDPEEHPEEESLGGDSGDDY